MWFSSIVCCITVLYVVYQYCMWYTSIYKYSPFYNSNNNTSSMRVYQYCMWYTSIYKYLSFYNYNNNTSSMWYTSIVCGIPVLYVVYQYLQL